MNTVPGLQMSQWFIENGASQSIADANTVSIAFDQDFVHRVSKSYGSPDFNVIENRCQYRHFSTGC